MKIYAIRDASLDKSRDLAWLLYYENEKTCFIEISRETGEWEAPLILSSYVKKGCYSLDSDTSFLWIEQRVVPPDRQNLGVILKANGLAEYDAVKLLLLAGGRCAQDECFLVPLRERTLPEELQHRLHSAIADVFRSGEQSFVFYRDGAIQCLKDTEFCELAARQKSRLNQYRTVIESVFPSPGGHAVRGNDNLEVTASMLRSSLPTMPFRAEDFYSCIRSSLIDTSEAAKILKCSRQNIQDLVRRGKLEPVYTTKNVSIFLRSDVLRRLL